MSKPAPQPDAPHPADPNPVVELVPAFTPGGPVPGLDSWLLVRRLGGGGFGEVWLAQHAWNDKEKPRAVKFCTDPDAKTRLVKHEKNVVLRVMRYAADHPHVVPLLECNLDGEIPWLMYEYVEGGTLATAIEEWRALAVPKRLGRAVRTLYAVAGALARFHRFDPPLVHRDLKPQNVLMAGGKVPRIIDFGIGGVAAAGTPNAATAFAARVPTDLKAAGSANYAPIEQRLGNPPDPRDDVHALGVIAYQLIVGDLRFAPGPDAKDVLRELGVPPELAALVVSSTATDPNRRPRDAGAWEPVLAVLIQKALQAQDPMTSSGTGSVPVILSEPPPDQTQPIPKNRTAPALALAAAPARKAEPEPHAPPGRARGLRAALAAMWRAIRGR